MRWWVIVAVVGLGCGLPEVTAEGVHVQVAADPGLELCGGTITHMDAFIAAVAAEFGVTAPTGDDRFTFYWVEAEDYAARTGCDWQSSGCTQGDRIFSKIAPLDHEFVHTLSSGFGWIPTFFNEGLAVAYQGLGAGDSFEPRGGSVLDTLTAREGLEVDYGTAGAFVRVLVERHGINKVLAVLDDLPHGVSESRVDRAFGEFFGESLADSVEAFEEVLAACPQRRWTAMLLECAAPEVAWDGAWVAEHRTLACDQEDVVGPYSGDTAVVFKTIAVEEGGWFDVAAIAEGGGVEVALTPCSGCDGETWVRANDGASRVRLEAGRYSLRLIGPALREVSVGWSLARVD